jgi:hypothetical protein
VVELASRGLSQWGVKVATYAYPHDQRHPHLYRLKKDRWERPADPPGTGHEKAFCMLARAQHAYSYHWRAPSKVPQLREHFGSLLYGLPALWASQFYRTGQPVYWTEGEKDADAITAAGGLAVSHWKGAGNSDPAQAARLRGAARVLIVADRDAAGAYCATMRRQQLRAAGLRPDQLAIVRAATGGPGSGADAADHLAAGLPLAALIPAELDRLERAAAKHAAERAERGPYIYLAKANA